MSDVVDAMKTELSNHGVTDVRLVEGSKHRRLCWIYNGREMFHIVSNGSAKRSDVCMLAVQDIRRMLGVNQGRGAGERRSGYRRNARNVIPPLPSITVRPDPMAPLVALKERMESKMEQLNMDVGAIPKQPRNKQVAVPDILPVPTAREREWLRDMLARGERERHVIIKRRITPGLAVALMELNTGNRKLIENQIQLHEERLKRGYFILTHLGIAVAKTRELNDGQHRLTAIFRSGVTADMMITFGAERVEFGAIDNGRPRGAADNVSVTIKDNPTLRASIAKLIVLAEINKRGIDPQICTRRAVELADDPTMLIAIKTGWAMSKVCAPSAAGMAYWWIAKHSRQGKRINEFFTDMPTGDGLTGVRLSLREWLRDKSVIKKSNFGGGNGGESYWRAAGIILVWNAWVKGNKTRPTVKSLEGLKLPEVN